MYLYLVVSQDTSVDNVIHKIICIRETLEKAREDLTFYRKLYQFDIITQTFAEVEALKEIKSVLRKYNI